MKACEILAEEHRSLLGMTGESKENHRSKAAAAHLSGLHPKHHWSIFTGALVHINSYRFGPHSVLSGEPPAFSGIHPIMRPISTPYDGDSLLRGDAL